MAYDTSEYRAALLLRSVLTDEQRECYQRNSYFDVVVEGPPIRKVSLPGLLLRWLDGDPSKRRYRIYRGDHNNIVEMTESGFRRIRRLCTRSTGCMVPKEDVMVMQKLMIEGDERGFLSVARVTQTF